MPATYVCFPLAPLGWHLWLFRCPSRPWEVRLAKLGILEHSNEDAAFIPKHFPLITLDMHRCKHKLAQITETIQVGLQEATCWLIYTLTKYLCPEEDSVQILKAEQPLPKVDFFPLLLSVKLIWEVQYGVDFLVSCLVKITFPFVFTWSWLFICNAMS